MFAHETIIWILKWKGEWNVTSTKITKNQYMYSSINKPNQCIKQIHVVPKFAFEHLPKSRVCDPIRFSQTLDRIDRVWWGLETPFAGWSQMKFAWFKKKFYLKNDVNCASITVKQLSNEFETDYSLVSNWLTACIFKSDKNHLFCKFDFYKQFLHGSSHIAVFFCLICIFWLDWLN